MSDVRKSPTCYHLFEPQYLLYLGSGPLFYRTITGSGACMGHQSQYSKIQDELFPENVRNKIGKL
jgi:hypothetical protein